MFRPNSIGKLSDHGLGRGPAIVVALGACLLAAGGVPRVAAVSRSANHPSAPPASAEETSPERSSVIQRVERITSILPVDAIEPVLPFWERLGFTHEVEVPHGDRLGFVILARDDAEVMLQTRTSLEDDVPALADGTYRSILFIEVDDLDSVIEALGDAEVVVPRRTTDYGADELFVREPGGHVVGFAEFGSE